MATFGTGMTAEQYREARIQQLQWDLAENKGRVAFYQAEVNRCQSSLDIEFGGTAVEIEEK